jgi:cystathionine beta-synthase
VTDKDAAIYNLVRRLAKEEGMFLGNSAGAAIKGLLQIHELPFTKDDVVVFTITVAVPRR